MTSPNPYASPSEQPIATELPQPMPYWLPAFFMAASLCAAIFIAAAAIVVHAIDAFRFD